MLLFFSSELNKSNICSLDDDDDDEQCLPYIVSEHFFPFLPTPE